MTDCVVLTEDAAEIAAAEENRTRAMRSDKGPLFAEVWSPARYEGVYSRLAETKLSRGPVDAALPRAENAVFEDRLRLPDFFFKHSGREIEISVFHLYPNGPCIS
jgi:hypothetical protein